MKSTNPFSFIEDLQSLDPGIASDYAINFLQSNPECAMIVRDLVSRLWPHYDWAEFFEISAQIETEFYNSCSDSYLASIHEDFTTVDE